MEFNLVSLYMQEYGNFENLKDKNLFKSNFNISKTKLENYKFT